VCLDLMRGVVGLAINAPLCLGASSSFALFDRCGGLGHKRPTLSWRFVFIRFS
jgi:hypothetical protein